MLPAIMIGAALGGFAIKEFGILLNSNAQKEEIKRRVQLMAQQNLLTEKQIELQQSAQSLQETQTESALTANQIQLSSQNIGVMDKAKSAYASMLAKEASSGLSLGSDVFANQEQGLEQESLYAQYLNEAQFNSNKINILSQAIGSGLSNASKYASGAERSLEQQFTAQDLANKYNSVDQKSILDSVGNVLSTVGSLASSTFTGGKSGNVGGSFYNFNQTKSFSPLINSLLG
jgi:UTP:GlnB (protein PII) uridylyltransferase